MSRWKELKDNPKKLELLEKRSHLLNIVREFFLSQNFIECDTPLLVKHPGMEPYLTPFLTNILDEAGQNYTAHLITSPEYSMKKLLAAGMNKMFQISKVFRNNESFGGTHNPEFTMIEWYRAEASYNDIITDTENLIIYLINKSLENEAAKIKNQKSKIKITNKNLKITYQGQVIDLSMPWLRVSVREAFDRFASLKLSELKIKKDEQYEDVFWKIFLNDIEPKLKELGRPVFIYDYPIALGALAKTKNNDATVAERFELYIGGLELANAFSELMNGSEQRQRLEEEQKLRQKLRKPVLAIDEDFIAALDNGPKTAAGIAIGIDRLVMLILDQKDINEVLWFGAKHIFTD